MAPTTQRNLRRVHTWIGMFFAPGVLFFSATGLIQTIGLQDGRNPPAWISWSAGIHKHQQAPRPRPPRPEPASGTRPDGPPREEEHEQAFVWLKPYVLLLAAVLFVTTAMGIAIAFANRNTRRTNAVLLGAGVVVPLVLMLV